MQYFSLKPNSEIWLKVVPILPSILFYAALNSFNEEITYRSPLLATLEPIGGSRQALWMAAYFFRHRALLWHARRHPGWHGLDLYGLDSGQRNGREARPVLDLVDSFFERYRHLFVSGSRYAAVTPEQPIIEVSHAGNPPQTQGCRPGWAKSKSGVCLPCNLKRSEQNWAPLRCIVNLSP